MWWLWFVWQTHVARSLYIYIALFCLFYICIDLFDISVDKISRIDEKDAERGGDIESETLPIVNLFRIWIILCTSIVHRCYCFGKIAIVVIRIEYLNNKIDGNFVSKIRSIL